jgi:CBS domain containing-hemolysin-like protein
MDAEKQQKNWSNYFTKSPKIFWIFYIILLIILIAMIIWFGWKGPNRFNLQNQEWILVYFLIMHGVFSPLIFYFRKKEAKKK